MVTQSLSTISSFEKDIRETQVDLPTSLTGAQGFVSTKSHISLKIMQSSLATESIEEEQPDIFEPNTDSDDELEDSTSIGGLDEASFFMVGRSTRFGRTIKFNSKFIS